MELVRSERLILRQWEVADVDKLIRITSKGHIAYWLPDWAECSHWALDWVRGTVKEGYSVNDPMTHFMTWAIVQKESDGLIGMINIGSDEYEKKEVGIGYFLDTDYENKGYMTEAVNLLCQHAFDMYNYPTIALMVQPDNVASIAVAKKAGFQFIEDIMSENGGMDRPVTQKLFRLTNPAMCTPAPYG